MRCATEWVAMFDDDVVIPRNWFEHVLKHVESDVGAISTVAEQGNKHAKAYDDVVNKFVKLEKVDTSPHINNILVRRDIFGDYDPPKQFFAEDHYFKEYVKDKGYKWVVIPNIGVKHLGGVTPQHLYHLGREYCYHYTTYQFIRRFVARMLFIPYASLLSHDVLTLYLLTSQNVLFTSGFLGRKLGLAKLI